MTCNNSQSNQNDNSSEGSQIPPEDKIELFCNDVVMFSIVIRNRFETIPIVLLIKSQLIDVYSFINFSHSTQIWTYEPSDISFGSSRSTWHSIIKQSQISPTTRIYDLHFNVEYSHVSAFNVIFIEKEKYSRQKNHCKRKKRCHNVNLFENKTKQYNKKKWKENRKKEIKTIGLVESLTEIYIHKTF